MSDEMLRGLDPQSLAAWQEFHEPDDLHLLESDPMSPDLGGVIPIIREESRESVFPELEKLKAEQRRN